MLVFSGYGRGRVLFWILCAACAWCDCARGVGLTGEQQQLHDITNTRTPLQLSRDGQWVVYVDSQGVLTRRAAKDPAGAVAKVPVPRFVSAMSVSRTAAKVAVLTREACVGIATFDARAGVPFMQWVPISLLTKSTKMQGTVSCATTQSWADYQDGAVHDLGRSIAISSDGTHLAVQAGEVIRIVDWAAARVVHELPVGRGLAYERAVLHLRFIDNNRKLLVVNAVLGSGYGTGASSDMQFAVWNLDNGELFNMHRTATKGTLIGYDFFWDYSEATGILWANNTQGNWWLPSPNDQKRAPVQSYAVSLRACGAQAHGRLALSGTDRGWLEFAADPYGRWVAVVEPVAAEDPMRSLLLLREARSGKLLAQWSFSGELRSLTSAPDGKTLHGVIAQTRTREQTESGFWNFRGGGSWLRIDLPAQVAAMPRNPGSPWPNERCLIESEQRDARDVELRPAKLAQVFSVSLSWMEEVRYKVDPETSCANEGMSEGMLLRNYAEGKWGASADGTIWVDRWSHLERINPDNGRVVQRIPTPRTRAVCSATLFAEQQFLSWQGDTVTLRPFASELALSERLAVAVKPGWRAELVFWVGGGEVIVHWVDARYSPKPHVRTSSANAMAIRYRVDGAAVQVVQTVHEGAGQSIWRGPYNFDSSYPFTIDSKAWNDRRRVATDAPYDWAIGHFGSVRATMRAQAQAPMPTVLWHGLRAPMPQIRPASVVQEVFGLGGDLGAAMLAGPHDGSRAVAVYDAAAKRRIALIGDPVIVDVMWVPHAKLLLVESGAQRDAMLVGYRLSD